MHQSRIFILEAELTEVHEGKKWQNSLIAHFSDHLCNYYVEIFEISVCVQSHTMHKLPNQTYATQTNGRKQVIG